MLSLVSLARRVRREEALPLAFQIRVPGALGPHGHLGSAGPGTKAPGVPDAAIQDGGGGQCAQRLRGAP